MNFSVIYTYISNSICGTELYGKKKTKIDLTNYSLQDLVTDYRYNSSKREFVNIKLFFFYLYIKYKFQGPLKVQSYWIGLFLP